MKACHSLLRQLLSSSTGLTSRLTSHQRALGSGASAAAPEGVYMVPMPKLSHEMTSGTITRWLKKPGDLVRQYDLIFEVSTDRCEPWTPSPHPPPS